MIEYKGNHENDWDALWINVNIATMVSKSVVFGGADTKTHSNDYGEIRGGAIAVSGSRIAWIGKQQNLPASPTILAARVYDAQGAWLTPGLIDCHTHLVFGGHRAREFEQRLNGASYEEIALAGGGIRSTVSATREASEEDLIASASKRLQALMREGVTSVEIKSGYGLDEASEVRMLCAAKALEQRCPVSVSTTFLGAHTVPVEYESRRSDYVSLVCERMIPVVAEENLADAVDVFCETIGFSVEETEKILAAAQKYGLAVKLHADQLSDTGGGELAARFRALSADHIEFVSEKSVQAMATSGTVAVLLPGAFYFLRETQLPPVNLLRRYQVPIAIATDSNPGSSPSTSLLLMLNMACTLFRLTPLEALAGVTCNAAKALGVALDRGTLEVGKRADFALWDVKEIAELCYWLGANHCCGVVKNGTPTDIVAA